MPIDIATNTKIIYLFVKKFKWTNTFDKETNVGHPKPGKIYRAVKNTDTNSYRVSYSMEKTFQGFFLDKLQNDDEAKGYISDIEEITIKNILDLDIADDQMRELGRWVESNDKELTDYLKKFFDGQTSHSSADGRNEKIAKILKSENPEMMAIVSMLTDLRRVDPAIYMGLGFFVSWLLTKEEESESSINDQWIRLDDYLGAGANLSSAIRKLSAYGGTDRRTNFMSKDLMGAVKDLLFEQYRQETKKAK